MEIQIIDTSLPGGRHLYDIVRAEVNQIPGELIFELRGPGADFRNPAIDPTVLVAIVTGASSALTALVIGLLQLLERMKPSGTIVIEGSKGTRIEIPAGTAREEIEFLTGLWRKGAR